MLTTLRNNARARWLALLIALAAIFSVGAVVAPPVTESADAAYYTCITNVTTTANWAGPGHDGSRTVYYGRNGNWGPLWPSPYHGRACDVQYVVIQPWTCVTFQDPSYWQTRYCAGSTNFWVNLSWRGYGYVWRS